MAFIDIDSDERAKLDRAAELNEGYILRFVAGDHDSRGRVDGRDLEEFHEYITAARAGEWPKAASEPCECGDRTQAECAHPFLGKCVKPSEPVQEPVEAPEVEVAPEPVSEPEAPEEPVEAPEKPVAAPPEKPKVTRKPRAKK
jgi:hypothetical protein